MTKQIIYEPHPVSAERKAELHAQGYRIVDARFAPADAPKPIAPPAVEPVIEVAVEPASEPVVEEAPKRRGRPAKVATEAQISDNAETASEE